MLVLGFYQFKEVCFIICLPSLAFCFMNGIDTYLHGLFHEIFVCVPLLNAEIFVFCMAFFLSHFSHHSIFIVFCKSIGLQLMGNKNLVFR